jgi:hypothetical protein
VCVVAHAEVGHQGSARVRVEIDARICEIENLPSLGQFTGEVAAVGALHCDVLIAGEEGVEIYARP